MWILCLQQTGLKKRQRCVRAPCFRSHASGKPRKIGGVVRKTTRFHNILRPLGWIIEQKIVVVPKKKRNVPDIGICLDTLFQQPNAQVRTVGEITESNPSSIVSIGIL